MTVKDLERLYDYNYWANAKLFAVVTALAPDEFTRPVAGSYGSIRNTLVHMLSAEWGWLDRCGGAKRGEKLNPDDYPTADSVIAAWKTVEGHVRGFLAQLTDADLDRIVEFTLGGPEPWRMPVAQMLQHAANHNVHHRGQVTLLIRALGHAPGNIDLLFYDAERASTARL